MNLSLCPFIASALAAERQSLLLADAAHRRRLDELPLGGKRDTAAARFLRAVRRNAMTGAARVATWGARQGQHWSLAGES
jgi:hypothetical protein